MGVEPKIGGFLKTPPKWMGENKGSKPYEQMDDLGGFPIFLETPMSSNHKLSAKQDENWIEIGQGTSPKSP